MYGVIIVPPINCLFCKRKQWELYMLHLSNITDVHFFLNLVFWLCHLGLFFHVSYNIEENISSYLSCSEVHEYPTRTQSNIFLKKWKYWRTQNNFEYVAIKLFKSIPIYNRNIDDNDKFKIKIKNVLLNNLLYNVSEFYVLKWM